MGKAHAPRPGAGARAEAAERTATVWTITLRGETRTCAFNNLPFDERALIRRATGLPLSAYTSNLDVDSVQVLWWVARRACGEKKLTLQQVLAEWPDDFTAADIDIDDGEDTKGEDDDPEA